MLIEMSERIMKKLKAVFYARVSTDHSDQLHSLKAQQDYFYQYLDNHPEFELVNSYVDEGITGTSIKKRKSFQKMINDALHHHFDIILTKEVTRFARNTLDTLQMVRLLKDAGKVTAAIAKIHAETEFEKYRIIQDQLYMSDFDRYLLELEEKMK